MTLDTSLEEILDKSMFPKLILYPLNILFI